MALKRPDIEEILRENETHRCDMPVDMCVKIVAIADLPTRFGIFQVVAFYNSLDDKEHAAFVKGDVVGQQNVPP